MILSICEVPDVLKVMKIIRTIITLIKIVVPILLIVTCMLDYTRAVNNPDELGDVNKGIIRKFIAAILIFLVPTLVAVVVKTVDPNGMSYIGCLNLATSSNISEMYKSGMEKRMEEARKNKDTASYNEAYNYLKYIEDEDLRKKYQNELNEIKKQIKDNSSNDNSSSNSESSNYKKYNLSQEDLEYLTGVCVREQGSAQGAAAEASLIANRFELYGSKYSSMANYVKKSGWFASSDQKHSFNNEQLEAVKDVLVNGNRTLPAYVDEHDCYNCNNSSCSNGNKGDICSLVNDGKTITSMSQITNKSSYVSKKTVINNKYGGTYTFYSFPCSNCDPFGYTSKAYKQVTGN